jgi:hypothetical protein
MSFGLFRQADELLELDPFVAQRRQSTSGNQIGGNLQYATGIVTVLAKC